MKKAWKQFLSLLLVLCLLTPLCGAASAAEGEEVQDTGYVGVFDYTAAASQKGCGAWDPAEGRK